MSFFFAVDGRLPKGKRFRGIVETTPTGVVLRGPDCLCDKPWDKRPLLLPELKKLAHVRPCGRPRWSATVQAQLEHKFQQATQQEEIMQRGFVLQLVEDIQQKQERDNG
jgi:type II secretory pathway predicted ATPase ExeA